ncbi:MAG: hypothetical protein HY749_04335 [Gammaproteobacteria bacterium]|nr:hypothetical protein [Gammaproteobacteria bacterium]
MVTLTGAATAGESAAVLEFEAQPDGKCQILSDGGKLVSLVNRRTDRAVKYRLVRYFADHPQNRVGGVIPASGVQALGCDTVDGRAQRWVVERYTIEGE